ncbi:MAG: hypothetical protein GF390_00615 [Candidatus Pacebacteria bacterium]|nr:hypothetical protein [Candidatus Paceibacterota bacterium]
MTTKHLDFTSFKWLSLPAVIVLAIGFFTITSASSLQAQTTAATQSGSMTEVKPVVDLSAQHQLYRDQVENYRQKHKAYVIAKDQFKAHETLASIEAAVNATREVMLARQQVLISYLELLQLELQQTHGIELTHKQAAETSISALIVELKLYQDLVKQSNNRQQLQERTSEFSDLAEQLKATGYYTLSLLKLGQLQNVYDQTIALKIDLVEQVLADQTELEPAKQRAVAETEQFLSTVDQELKNQWTQLDNKQIKQINSNFYQQLTKKLNPVYADLAKSLSYLEELLNL